MSLRLDSSTLVLLAICYLWQSPNSPISSCCNPSASVYSLISIRFKHVFLFFFIFLPPGMAGWAWGSEDASESPCLTYDWALRGIHCLSRMTQQLGGPPKSKWREVRMGANGSSYPHSCSPRIGGNAQAQQTFIGMYFIWQCDLFYSQNINCSVTSFCMS